jgi:hypothetical protein
MENRIQINGVWYVKEEQTPTTALSYEIDDNELTYSESCVYENDKYCFEATRIFKNYDSGEIYTDIVDIEFTDKRRSNGNWITEYWDEMGWFNNLLERNYDSIEIAKKYMCFEGVETFISFLKILKHKGWL